MNTNNHHKILFERPNLDELRRQYAVVDLHFHSNYSDGFNTIDIIAKRARELGIGIAVTDHNEIKGSVEIDGNKSVFSIPGIEITSKEGTHILVYFYDIKSLKEFYRNAVKPNMGNEIMSSTFLEMRKLLSVPEPMKRSLFSPTPIAPHIRVSTISTSRRKGSLTYTKGLTPSRS